MIGIDTNVLVRYLVQDDVQQSKKATDFLLNHCTIGSPGFINCVVLSEVCWVLESRYKFPRKEISVALRAIIDCRQFRIENIQCVTLAIGMYERETFDFSDILIGEINKMNGCSWTITFDKKASKTSLFEELK